MRFRQHDSPLHGRSNHMMSLIDVVFLLLIFFMLTLKVLAPEGDFEIRAAPRGSGPATDIPQTIRIRLTADENGALKELFLGQRSLGNDARAYKMLNDAIGQIVRGSNNLETSSPEVEIDADYELNYEFIIRAVSACTGRLDPKSKQIVRYVEKIKFAPPRRPTGA